MRRNCTHYVSSIFKYAVLSTKNRNDRKGEYMGKIKCSLQKFRVKDNGITTVEAILLMVVLVAVVLLFKDQVMDLVSKIMDKVTNQAMRI